MDARIQFSIFFQLPHLILRLKSFWIEQDSWLQSSEKFSTLVSFLYDDSMDHELHFIFVTNFFLTRSKQKIFMTVIR